MSATISPYCEAMGRWQREALTEGPHAAVDGPSTIPASAGTVTLPTTCCRREDLP